MATSHSQLCRKLSVLSLEDRSVPAAITGSVFEDLNGNASRDGGEPALAQAGITVYLDQNGNGVRDVGDIVTQTLADGSYGFAGLAAGTYSVRQEVPVGWTQTTSSVAAQTAIMPARSARSNAS